MCTYTHATDSNPGWHIESLKIMSQCAGSVYIGTSLDNSGRITSPLWLCMFLLLPRALMPVFSSLELILSSLLFPASAWLLIEHFHCWLPGSDLVSYGCSSRARQLTQPGPQGSCCVCLWLGLQLGAGFFCLFVFCASDKSLSRGSWWRLTDG